LSEFFKQIILDSVFSPWVR